MTTATKAKAHPGLKLQTPIEIKVTAAAAAAERKRWEYLFDKPLNKYSPTK